MSRSLLVLLALVLGCVIALAIAVVRSLWVDYSVLVPFLVTEAEVEAFRQNWQANRPGRFPEVSQFNKIDGVRGVGITDVGLGIEDRTSIFRITRFRAGWPLKCVEGDHWRETSLGPDTTLPGRQMILGGRSNYDHVAVILPNQIPLITMARGKFLPYGVRWGGLAINTLVYAVALLASYAGFLWLRARRRVGEGCCRACGYQLQDLTTCPECGMSMD